MDGSLKIMPLIMKPADYLSLGTKFDYVMLQSYLMIVLTAQK